MAQLTINVRDADAPRVLLGFSTESGYQEQVPSDDGTMIDNPETRLAFSKRVLREFVLDRVRQYEGRNAAETARVAAEAAVLADIVLS